MAESRVVIVTGAAQGAGLACARRFMADGCRVVLADRDAAAGAAAASRLGDDEALFVHCDVGSRLAVHNLVAEAINAFGRIDVLVNTAGVVADAGLLALDAADFDRAMAVNVKGPLLLSQAVARQMIEQVEAPGARRRDLRARHAIVNVSPMEDVAAAGDSLAGAVSAGALAQMTRACAAALAPWGVRVNAVAANANAAADPDEIAAVVAFLASPDASCLTGEIVVADGARLALQVGPQPG